MINLYRQFGSEFCFWLFLCSKHGQTSVSRRLEVAVMKSEFFHGLILLFVSFSLVESQSQSLTCIFQFTQSTLYTCSLESLNVADDESQTFTFTGNHLDGMNDDDVARIEVYGGSVPFIIPEFFTTFPNVRILVFSPAGLRRIQPNAFMNATNLLFFASYRNPLRSFEANAFTGASNLNDIDVYDNELDIIHENAFVGLDNLHYLNLGANLLENLHPNVFRPLSNIIRISLAVNHLESLQRDLFANNQQLEYLSFYINRINAIDRGFIDSFEGSNLNYLDLLHNQCVDALWIIDESTTLDTIRSELEECFANAEPDDVRTFILELRGSLILRDQNGTEILRL